VGRLGLGSGPHDNGKSLYIVDWRMVVVERENVLNNVKREGELFGRGKCREEHVQGNMSYTHICDAIPPSIYRDTRSFRHGRMDSVAERNATHRNSAIPPARCWNSQTCGKYNTVLLAASSYVTQWLLSPNVESKSGSSPPFMKLPLPLLPRAAIKIYIGKMQISYTAL